MNTRPPPPQGPRTPLMTKLFRGNLRPIVIITSIMTAVWSISASIGFYRNIGPYNDNGAPKLATISIVIGSIYIGVFLIGLFGIAAGVSRKLALVRIFAYLSALAVLMVSGVSLLRVIIHFTMRKTILDACANVTTGDIFFYGGWWGPVYSGTLSPLDAQRYCTRYYDRDSWSLIFGFIILTLIGIFFSLIAFNFLRQTLDPLAPGNVMRDPQRTAGFSSQYYTAAYDTNNHNNPGFRQGYAPPPGPPPPPFPPYSGAVNHDDDDDYPTKPPGYTNDGGAEWEDMQKKRDEGNGPKTGDVRY